MIVVEKNNGVIDLQKEIEKEFNSKLDEFVNGELDASNYDGYTPIGDEVLVKLFKFTPSEQCDLLGRDMIMVQSPVTKEWKPSMIISSEKIFPLVRILKVGIGVNKGLKEGDVCTVPAEDIYGKTWNPDFLQLANTFAKAPGSQGKLVNVPEDMPQKIPSMEKNWKSYKFMKVDVLGEPKDDENLVYLIPTLKLKTFYKRP